MNTILVTGATGNIGRPLVTLLADAGMHVRAVTRDLVRAAPPVGVEAVESAVAGVAGCRAVFLNSRALQNDLGATVEAAREAGVSRLVALSAINADDPFALQPSRVRGDRNKEVEDLAVGSGLDWVSLRPTVFASNFAGMWGPQLRAGDVVGGPYASASTAPIVDADVAAVAAAALLDDDLVGRRIPLTGPAALTNTELVETIGAVLGRALTYHELPAESVRQRFLAIGFQAEFADAYLGLLGKTVSEPALVTGEVDKILGRPATTFAHWVSDHRDLFTNQ
ncbi:MAG: NAD(P)H-binding protein [Mycobacterium sp.]|nr:NAD(P)H-binding protein [Mycobacterium sp.]